MLVAAQHAHLSYVSFTSDSIDDILSSVLTKRYSLYILFEYLINCNCKFWKKMWIDAMRCPDNVNAKSLIGQNTQYIHIWIRLNLMCNAQRIKCSYLFGFIHTNTHIRAHRAQHLICRSAGAGLFLFTLRSVWNVQKQLR